MDPVGGWPYAYNRLVAATASGTGSGNFAHLASGGTTTPGSHTATPLIVQPTATGVNHPYGATTFLAPPTVGYDVFSQLFHPHAAAAAAQVTSALSQSSNNNNSNNNGGTTQIHQQGSSSSSNSSSSTSTSQQQQQHQQQQQQYYENARGWSGASSIGNGGHQQQLQFGLIPSPVNNAPSSSPAPSVVNNSSLATITRVNSNGSAASTSSVYDNYNAQLKAHSLYHLNSQLANAAVMASAAAAMANKLNSNRTMSLPQSSPSNNSCSGGGGTSNNNNNSSSNYSGGSSDRTKVQQDYVNQSSSAAKNTAAAVISSSNSNSTSSSPLSSSGHGGSGTTISLVNYEATKLQSKGIPLAMAQTVAMPQQSSPISYSMWDNNSPIQNKFSCGVAQQQQQQQQQIQQINQQQTLRKPMQTPSPVGSAFTKQSQIGGAVKDHLQSVNQQQQQQQQQSLQQDAIYMNHRLKANSSTESVYSNQGNENSRGTTSAVVPRRPSPMQFSQASPQGHVPSPAYPIYNSPMKMNQQYTANINNSNADGGGSMGSSSGDGYNQNNQSEIIKSQEIRDTSVGYPSVITRVAGSAWEQMSERSSTLQDLTAGSRSGTEIGNYNNNNLNNERIEDSRTPNKAPKKRKPVRAQETEMDNESQRMQSIGGMNNQQKQQNQQSTWQHPAMSTIQQQQQQIIQQQQQSSQQSVKQSFGSPSSNNANNSFNSALTNQPLSTSSSSASAFGAVNNNRNYSQAAPACQAQSRRQQQSMAMDEEEEDVRRMEQLQQQARSQVVVPNIMEELNFLTADGIKARRGTAIQDVSPPSKSNGKVQIISVQSQGITSVGAGTTTRVEKKANAEKPEDKGFIGSYLKFLQGEQSPMPSATGPPRVRKPNAPKADPQQRKETNEAAAGGSFNNKRKTNEDDGTNGFRYVEPAKRGRSDVDDQGYVPNGGGAFDQYQQQYQPPYMHPGHPLQIPASHHPHYHQGQLAPGTVAPLHGASVATPQMLPQSYNPAEDGFNYFDFQFRPRW